MDTQSNEISGWKNFLVNAGFHCMALGMMGVLALIIIGFITCLFGLPKWVFYSSLGAGLILGILWSVFCMRCNCSSLRKNKE